METQKTQHQSAAKVPEKALSTVKSDKNEMAANPEMTLEQIMAGEMEQTGFENTSSTDFVMPLLKILQKLSPELNASKPAYIKEAKVGQFLDTSTGELMDSVEFIPCLYKPQMVEWKAKRGGFVASHEPGVEQGLARNEKNQFVRPGGPEANILMDTRYFYGLRKSKTGELVPNIIALKSADIKTAKSWMSDMLAQKTKNKRGEMVPLPIFIHVCKLTAVFQTKGENDWFAWNVELERHINKDEMAVLSKAQEARTTFQASAANMRPVEEETVVENSQL